RLRGGNPRHPRRMRAYRTRARGEHHARAHAVPGHHRRPVVVRGGRKGRAVRERRAPAGQGGGGLFGRDPDGRSRRLQARRRPDSPLAPVILRPTSPAHGGAAIARDEGKVWLVNYALPGEVVEAEPRGKQGGVAVADTTQVLEPSPHRVTPPCPHFGQCGGCQLQHAAYAHQLELKRQVVEEAWSRAGLRLPPDTP